MIKAILYDVDGVLIDISIEKAQAQIERDWGISPQQTAQFFHHEFVECLTGEKDLKEEITPYLKKWGWNSSVNAYLDYWFTTQDKRNTEVINDIKILKEKGIHVSIATNQEKYRAEYLANKLGFKMLFDDFFASSTFGIMKKHPEFFEKIITSIKYKPNEILFWDDTPKYVEAAKSIGIHGEVYTTYENYKEIMKRYYL